MKKSLALPVPCEFVFPMQTPSHLAGKKPASDSMPASRPSFLSKTGSGNTDCGESQAVWMRLLALPLTGP